MIRWLRFDINLRLLSLPKLKSFGQEIAEIWAVMEFCPTNPTQSVGGEKLVLRLDLLYEEVNTRNFSSKG